MKRIDVRDDDDGQFRKELTSYALEQYKKLTKEMRRMVKQQSKSFWIKFVTSYRANYIKSTPYESLDAEEIANQEEAFIDILKLLTEEKRFSELSSLADTIENFFSAANKFIEAKSKLSIKSISLIARATSKFEPPLDAILVYTRFVRSMVELYNKWKHAPRESQRTPPAKWNPPSHWIDSTKSPSIYEQFLWDKWGRRLYGMLGVNREQIHLFEKPHHPNSASGDKSASHTLKGKTNTPAVKKVPNCSKTKKGRRKRGTQRYYNSSIPKSKSLSDPEAMEAAFEETSMDMDDCSEHSIHKLKNNDYSVTEKMNATAYENNTNGKGGRRNLGSTNHNIIISEAEEASGCDAGTETDTEEYFMETAEHNDLFDHAVVTENKMESEEYRDIQCAKRRARSVNNKSSKPLSHVYGTKTDKYNIQSAKDPGKNVNRDNNSHNVSTSKPCSLVSPSETTTSGVSGRKRKFFDYSKLFGIRSRKNVNSNEENKSGPSKSSSFITDTNVDSNEEDKSGPSKSSSFFTDTNVTSNEEDKSEPSKSSSLFTDTNVTSNEEDKSEPSKSSSFFTDTNVTSNEEDKSGPSKSSSFFTDTNVDSNEENKSEPSKSSSFFTDTNVTSNEEDKSEPSKSSSFFTDTNVTSNEEDKSEPSKSSSFFTDTNVTSNEEDKSEPSKSSSFITDTNVTSNEEDKSEPSKSSSFFTDTNVDSNEENKSEPSKSSSFFTDTNVDSNEENKSEPSKFSNFFNYDNLFHFSEHKSILKRKVSNESTPETVTSQKTASGKTNKRKPDKYSAKDMAKNISEKSPSHVYVMESDSEQSALDLRKNGNGENNTNNVSIGNDKSPGFTTLSETTSPRTTASGNAKFVDYSKLFDTNIQSNEGSVKHQQKSSEPNYNNVFYFGEQNSFSKVDSNDNPDFFNKYSDIPSAIDMTKHINDEYGAFSFYDYGMKSESEQSPLDLRKNVNRENITHNVSIGNSKPNGFISPSETTTSRETTRSENATFFDRSKRFAFNMDTNDQYDEDNARATTSGNTTFFDHSKHFGFNMNTSDKYDEDNATATTSGNTTFFDHSKHFSFNMNTSDQYNEENARATTSGNTTFFDFRTNENDQSNDSEIHRMKEHDTFVNYANTYEQTEIIGNTEQENLSSSSSRTAEDNVNKKESSKDTDYFMYDRLFNFETGQTSEHTEKMEDDIDVVGDCDDDGAVADDDVHIGFSDHENSPNGGFNPNGYNGFNQNEYNGFNPFEYSGFNQYGYPGYNLYPGYNSHEFYSALFALFGFGYHGFSPYAHGHFQFGGIPFFQSQAAFLESLINILKCLKQKPVKPVKKYLLQKCSNCNMLEEKTESFKECSDCIKSKISYVYCGIHCKDIHLQRDHKKFQEDVEMKDI